jgi:hypothetical protein
MLRLPGNSVAATHRSGTNIPTGPHTSYRDLREAIDNWYWT